MDRIGIHVEKGQFTAKSNTANGIVLVAPVMLKEITIGDISVQNIAAVVIPDQGLHVSLLGMSFLSRLSRYEMVDKASCRDRGINGSVLDFRLVKGRRETHSICDVREVGRALLRYTSTNVIADAFPASA